MIENQQLPLGDLAGTRASRLLTYPKADLAEAQTRINELLAANITALRFRGPTRIDGIPVLGKGCVGIVVQATLGKATIALKIRRTDANRTDMMEEARLLRAANSVNVGPRLITATRNFLAMQLYEGQPLYKWVQHQRNIKTLRQVLKHLLFDCFRLDSIGLDHGELSRAPKNVLVEPNGSGRIVDFETASMVRRPANVTSLLQYFMFGAIAKNLQPLRLFAHKTRILHALSQYKHECSVASYQNLLETLRLTDSA
jgi:putative serine/threonine protein kinase